MQYAKVVTPAKEALVALEPSNWGADYQKLFDQTDVSGAELWAAYSHANFNNPLQKSDEARYEAMHGWAEILRDVVREDGRGTDDKGRLGMNYVSHAGTEWEKTHKGIWAPKSGFWVPTADGIFYEGTLIPFETVQDKKEAVRRLEAKGIPANQVSYFFRLDNYEDDRFVGRFFGPDWLDSGRFYVDAGRLPSNSGNGGVASRPAYGKPEIVMEVDAPQAVNAA